MNTDRLGLARKIINRLIFRYRIRRLRGSLKGSGVMAAFLLERQRERERENR